MSIYLVFEFVGQDVHVFDVILTTSKPPHRDAIHCSYIELDDSSLSEFLELDEFQRQLICKIYYPIILTTMTLTTSKARTKVVYQVHITMFAEIIKNTIAVYVPHITKEMLFDKLLLTVDKKKTKPQILEYLKQLEYHPDLEQELKAV